MHATQMIGIGRATLERWLLDGKVPEPMRLKNGGVNVRIWTDRDVERVRKYKEKNYYKGRGPKPKAKR